MILHSQPISAANFAPYGSLVSSAGLNGIPVNEGRGLRLETAAKLIHTTSAPKPNLALYQIEGSNWPVPVKMLERHRHSAQMFLPLNGGSFLIVVAGSLATGEPEIASLQAFTVQRGQGIVYAPGVWHLPLVALEHHAEFAMLMWEDGTQDDCDERLLASPFMVQQAQGGLK